MRKWPFVWVIGVYTLFAVAEVWSHWYAATKEAPLARSLKEWYLYREPVNQKAYHEGAVDLMYPSIVLGFAAGSLTVRRKESSLLCCVVLLALGVVALIPVYNRLFVADKNAWASASTSDRYIAFAIEYMKAFCMCGVFACIGRIGTQYLQAHREARL